jgi:hypothetical protein
MQRSLNEITNEIRKAARGAGFPIGHAQELADATAWLISYKVDCVDCVLRSFNTGYESAAPSLKFEPSSAGKKQFFLKGINAASHGVGIRDMMIADGGLHKFYLSETDNMLLLFSVLNSNCICENYSLIWTFEDGSIFRVPSDLAKPDADRFIAGVEKQKGNVNLTFTPDTRGSHEQIEQNNPSSNGYFINEDLWHQIKAFAAKTYVPASEASRTKGAGAAINDND